MSFEEAFAAGLRQALRDPGVREGLAAALRPVVRAELDRGTLSPTMDSAEVGGMLKKSPGALLAFLSRNPSFPHKKVGKRLVFDRLAVERWIDEHPKKAPGRGP